MTSTNLDAVVGRITTDCRCIEITLGKLGGRKWRVDTNEDAVKISELANDINKQVAKLKEVPRDNLKNADLKLVDQASQACLTAQNYINTFSAGLVEDKATEGTGIGYVFNALIRNVGWFLGFRALPINKIDMEAVQNLREQIEGLDNSTKLPVVTGDEEIDFSIEALDNVSKTSKLEKLRQNQHFVDLEAMVKDCGLQNLRYPKLLKDISIPDSCFLYQDGDKFVFVDHRQKDVSRYTLKATPDGIECNYPDSVLPKEFKSITDFKNSQGLLYGLYASDKIVLKLQEKLSTGLMVQEGGSFDKSDQKAIEKSLLEAQEKSKLVSGLQCALSKVWNDGENFFLSKISENGKIEHFSIKPRLTGSGGIDVVQKGLFSDSILATASSLRELESTFGVPTSHFGDRRNIELSLLVPDVKSEEEAVSYVEDIVKRAQDKDIQLPLPPYLDLSFKDEKGMMHILRFELADIPLRGGPKYIEIPVSTSSIDPRGKFGGQISKSWSQTISDLRGNLEELENATSISASDYFESIRHSQDGYETAYDQIPDGLGKENCYLTTTVALSEPKIIIKGEVFDVTIKDSTISFGGKTYSNSRELKNALQGVVPFEQFLREYQKKVGEKQRVLEEKVFFLMGKNQLQEDVSKIPDGAKDFAGVYGIYPQSYTSITKPSYQLSYIDKDGKVQSDELIVTDRGYRFGKNSFDSLIALVKSLDIGTGTLQSPYDKAFLEKLEDNAYIASTLQSSVVSYSKATNQQAIEKEIQTVAESIGTKNADGLYRIWQGSDKQYHLTQYGEKGLNTIIIGFQDNTKAIKIGQKSIRVNERNWNNSFHTELGLVSPSDEQKKCQQLKQSNQALLGITGKALEEKDVQNLQQKLNLLKVFNSQALNGLYYLKANNEKNDHSCTLVCYNDKGEPQEKTIDLTQELGGYSVDGKVSSNISRLESNLGLKKSIHDIDSLIQSNSGSFAGSCFNDAFSKEYADKILKDFPVGTSTMFVRWPEKPQSFFSNPWGYVKSCFSRELSDNPTLTFVIKTKEGVSEPHNCPLEMQADGSIKFKDVENCPSFGSLEKLQDNLYLLELPTKFSDAQPADIYAEFNKKLKEIENKAVLSSSENVSGVKYQPVLQKTMDGFSVTVIRNQQGNLPYAAVQCSITRSLDRDGKVLYTVSFKGNEIARKAFDIANASSKELTGWIKESFSPLFNKYDSDQNTLVQEKKRIQDMELKSKVITPSNFSSPIQVPEISPQPSPILSNREIQPQNTKPVVRIEKHLAHRELIRPQWVDRGTGFLGDMKSLSAATLRNYGKAALGDKTYKLPAKYKINQLKENGDYYKLLIRGMANTKKKEIVTNEILKALPLLELFQLYELACFEDNRAIPEGVEEIFATKFDKSTSQDQIGISQYIEVALSQAKDATDYKYYKGLQDRYKPLS